MKTPLAASLAATWSKDLQWRIPKPPLFLLASSADRPKHPYDTDAQQSPDQGHTHGLFALIVSRGGASRLPVPRMVEWIFNPQRAPALLGTVSVGTCQRLAPSRTPRWTEHEHQVLSGMSGTGLRRITPRPSARPVPEDVDAFHSDIGVMP